ncbi:receptor-type guanylate cyclase gcy-28-like [Liolophura sinensis]|uniref:receptor-type guanylate cyclase gcy-28-like n=1 Tax=Liolophura sinensis TaxID=3198878 RepID=UPI003158ADE5
MAFLDDCATKPSGLLASFWNLPMFSPASTDPILGDKATYRTLVRLGPPFNKLGLALVEVLRHFNWSRVVLVSRRKTDEKKVFCDYSFRSAEEQFRLANITVADKIQISDNLDIETIDDILTRVQQRARVIILCTENRADLRKILLQAHGKGMTDGDYVFFVPDQLPPSNVAKPWVTNSDLDQDVKKAFTTVFQITVAEMAGSKVEQFRDLIPIKMGQPPWNYTTSQRGSLYSPFLHDAVYLYLLVLNETLAEGNDPRNGTLMFQKATGKTFEDEDFLIALIPMVVCLFIGCILAGIMYYRRFRLEQELRLMLWKVNYEDIVFTQRIASERRNSLVSIQSTLTTGSSSTRFTINGLDGQIFSLIATYKGTVVSLKVLSRKIVNICREDQLELKAMRDLNHPNVNAFSGLCIDDRLPCLLTAYCSKGSIQDIIENDELKLDWMFKFSLIRDIVNGLQYIHDSSLKWHGNLKSSNCVVDNRWVAKLTDFGMTKLRQLDTDFADQENKALLWTAPELLSPQTSGMTKAADIYSLAIVMYEIIFRKEPYDMSKLSPQEIIEKVRSGSQGCNSLMRPEIIDSEESDVEDKRILQLIQVCWDEETQKRPNINDVKGYLRKLNNGNKKDIVDNMLNLLEKYASNLEGIVQERTQQLVEEKKKTDRLLYSMLPQAVAERLKLGQIVPPELFDSVTIFFSDIVGFTSLSSESTPMQVVDLLNDLYTCFDSTIAEHDVYKVETIGDAYMVVSGAPLRNGGKHPMCVADMALDLLSATVTFNIRHRPGSQLQLRVGIHTGPCAAGVVGQTMPRYCLFGDTVNTASRMESNGEALKIHVSQESYHALQIIGGYVFSKRGEVSMKGKGLQTTYWLLGKHGYRRPLPVP